MKLYVIFNVTLCLSIPIAFYPSLFIQKVVEFYWLTIRHVI